MSLTMVSTPMLSLHTATACGGIGDSITAGAGDGAHLGIIVAGIHRASGMVDIGVDGILTITIIIRIGAIITTHTMVGQVLADIGAEVTGGTARRHAIRGSTPDVIPIITGLVMELHRQVQPDVLQHRLTEIVAIIM